MSDSPSSVWALGDYPRLAREVLSGLGPPLVQACGVASGQRVLDLAAGSGVAAIPAAAAGASVVAADITPELLEAGHAEAARHGLKIEWVEADAQALPFADGDFDVVMSCIGAMFASNHQQVADEMLRVCRPGGVIGMANWTPDGSIGQLLRVFAKYAQPSPQGALGPVAWGTEEHLRRLFCDRVESLWMEQRKLPVDRFADADEYCAYYKATFGPTIAAYARIAEDPELVSALDRDLLTYAERANRARPGERARYEYEYLLVVARTR
jgi:SAM-dependent methyltransferase